MIFYEDANTEIYLEHEEFYVKTYFPFHIYELTYQQLIEEIYSVPDRSEAWKRLTVIQAGKAAGILSEVAS